MGIGSNDVVLLITKVETACNNALSSSGIMEILTNYAYSAEALNDVKSGILSDLKTAAANKKNEYGEQFLATDKVNKLKIEFDKSYKKHLSLLRISFSNNPVKLKTLYATGRRLTSYTEWFEQAEMFYTSLLNDSDALEELAKLNTTLTEITGMQNKLKALNEAKKNQGRQKGEAQRATEARDKKYKMVEAWYKRFEGVAKIAFAETPQQLEIMGIFVRN